MYSAGALTRAQRDELNRLGGEDRRIVGEMQPLYDKLGQIQDQADAAAADKSEVGNAEREAQEAHVDAERESQTAESEWRTEKADAKGRKDRLEQKEEQRTAYLRSVQDLERKLQTDNLNLGIAERMANFFKERFQEDCENQYTMACMQAIEEDNRAGGEILSAFWRGCAIMNAAMLGLKTTVSGALDKPKYLNIADEMTIKPTYLTYEEEAEAQAARNQDLANQIAEKRADPFYDDEVADAGRELAEANGKRDGEKARFDAAKAEKDGAKAKREDEKSADQDSEERERDVQAHLREQQEKIREKQAKREELGIDKQKIQTDASVDNRTT